MKKILSAVLAAAMVLSMGVMAFADASFGFGTATAKEINQTDAAKTIAWQNVYVERDNAIVGQKAANTSDEVKLEAGDILYFTFKYGGAALTGSAPENWKIKINNADFVEDADFHKVVAGEALNTHGLTVNDLVVMVELESDFDHYDEDEVKFYFYLYDTKYKTESERVKLAYDFKGYTTEEIDANDLNWVLAVNAPTTYKYSSKSKAKKATLDFNETALVELKMYPGEKYTVSGVEKYNKELSKEYDTEVSTIDLRGIEGGDLVLTASKDNKQVVMVVDGELVPVEAEYVKGYKFESGEKTTGYLVEKAEEGVYALISADIELEDEDIDLDDDTTSAPVEDNKKNPPMGANDFVGAAVALAVVSVAAAGALALKK